MLNGQKVLGSHAHLKLQQSSIVYAFLSTTFLFFELLVRSGGNTGIIVPK